MIGTPEEFTEIENLKLAVQVLTDENRELRAYTGNRVAGFCPMGCGRTLYRSPTEQIVCANEDCSNRDSVSTLLAADSRFHQVLIHEGGFKIVCPLGERLSDVRCSFHIWMQSLDGPPKPDGSYLVRRGPNGWIWQAVSGH